MTDSPKPTNSLLSEIIKASQGKEVDVSSGSNTPSNTGIVDTNGDSNVTGGPNDYEPPQKNKQPIDPITLLKGIGAIFLVAVIFFGSFLAYVVFNPEQAQFFVSTFGIDPREVATLLKRLITGSFGVIFLILSISWIIALFRAIWTPKEFKRKKALSWITAVFIGVILFSFITFWAYLFKILNATDFVNPEGLIGIYDTELYNSEITRSYSSVNSTTNLIGPITLTFEIGSNAAQIQKKSLIEITSYEIDFDGATCNGSVSKIQGSDPINSKGIVCTFDEIRPYNVSGQYKGVDRFGKSNEIPMNLPPIEVRGIVGVKQQKNRNNEDIITLDASSLQNLGSPRWVYKSNGKEVDTPSITEKILDTPQIVLLKVFSDEYDRVFLIKKNMEKAFSGMITVNQDASNSLRYTFEIEGKDADNTDITSITWSLNDGSIICRGNSLTCDYTFGSYAKYSLTARIELANNDNYTLEHIIVTEPPLIMSKKVRVKDANGKLLNTEDTYDTKLRAFVVKDVIPPTHIIFDARDVVTENPEYRLSHVTWTFSDGTKTEQKEGMQVSYEITNPLRYTVNIRYTFTPNVTSSKENGEKILKDTVIFDIEHKSLIPRFTLQVPRDYVPVIVTIDGSQSYTENGEIKKFTYNFGEGKPPVEGDAIQQYEFKEAGEKIITLIITNNQGESATLKKTLVLKGNPKIVDFTPSISPGVVGVPTDFTPYMTEGDIADYIWTFGDNTQSVNDALPTHTYKKSGTYTVTLTVVYIDGTRKTSRKEFEVAEEIQ